MLDISQEEYETFGRQGTSCVVVFSPRCPTTTRHIALGRMVPTRTKPLRYALFNAKKRKSNVNRRSVPSTTNAATVLHHRHHGRAQDMRRPVTLDAIFPRLPLSCSRICGDQPLSQAVVSGSSSHLQQGQRNFEQCQASHSFQVISSADRVWVVVPKLVRTDCEAPLQQWNCLRVVLLWTFRCRIENLTSA